MANFKVVFHFAATEMFLFVFLFSFELGTRSKVPTYFEIQIGCNFKTFFPVPFPIIYNPGFHCYVEPFIQKYNNLKILT